MCPVRLDGKAVFPLKQIRDAVPYAATKPGIVDYQREAFGKSSLSAHRTPTFQLAWYDEERCSSFGGCCQVGTVDELAASGIKMLGLGFTPYKLSEEKSEEQWVVGS